MITAKEAFEITNVNAELLQLEGKIKEAAKRGSSSTVVVRITKAAKERLETNGFKVRKYKDVESDTVYYADYIHIDWSK